MTEQTVHSQEVYLQDLDTLFTRTFPRLDSNLETREDQLLLSKEMKNTMNSGGVFIAEAGTGIGKSFAYLVPAIQQAMQNKQVVIVTATIALQHQLAEIDIPRIQKLMGTNASVTVLKGKTNYLCMSRLNTLLQEESSTIIKDERMNHMGEIESWAKETTTGDKEELGFFLKEKEISNTQWKAISTHEYSCGGKKCQMNQTGCFYRTARQKAKQSQIIITNYNLLSYHLQNIENEMEGLLPDEAIFILDEAHNLRDITRTSMRHDLSLYDAKQTFESLFGKSGSIVQEQGVRGGAFETAVQKYIDNIKLKFNEVIKKIEDINIQMSLLYENTNKKNTNMEINYDELLVSDKTVLDKFYSLAIDLQTLVDLSDQAMSFFNSEEIISGILRQYQRWWSKSEKIAQEFSQEKKGLGIVRSCNIKDRQQATFSVAPVFVNEFLAKNFFERSYAVICTSATLSYNKSFDLWMKRNGVTKTGQVKTQMLESPFPYEENVCLAIPVDAPNLRERARDYEEYLADCLPKLLDISEGRALILCTSYRMVENISDSLRKQATNKVWSVLEQDKKESISSLAEKFRRNEHAVLVGTASFWEGFDASGDTLKLLVITNMPFPHPENLFIKEESKIVEGAGGFSFTEVSLPEAEQRLRQGFGRLMRSASDSGVVFLSDNRLLKKPYKKQIVSALPKCEYKVKNTQDIIDELRRSSKF